MGLSDHQWKPTHHRNIVLYNRQCIMDMARFWEGGATELARPAWRSGHLGVVLSYDAVGYPVHEVQRG